MAQRTKVSWWLKIIFKIATALNIVVEVRYPTAELKWMVIIYKIRKGNDAKD